MPDQFDIVVAGAGHNSLIAAAYLAKAGYRCLVLESRALVGGGVKTTQLTLRGFKHDVCSSAHVLIQDSPILRDDELGLGQYGLEYLFPDPVVHLPFPDGSYITQWRDM
ncbi:MAG TPA: NAD(P)-binding protein, partial [Candidatus Acidoferrum sp.]|nr:NAD(P)-binding protein [Candidatus Acidoferrum sp.]